MYCLVLPMFILAKVGLRMTCMIVRVLLGYVNEFRETEILHCLNNKEQNKNQLINFRSIERG